MSPNIIADRQALELINSVMIRGKWYDVSNQLSKLADPLDMVVQVVAVL